MMSRLSPEAQHLLKLLDDGEWHPYAEIYARLTAAIAPGKALRRFDTNARSFEARHGPRRGPEPSDEAKIASGQKSIAADVITSMRKRHVEITDEPGADKRIRRRADLPEQSDDPGAGGPDATSAAAEHTAGGRQRTDPAVAFFSEAAIRAIVRDEVGRAFDRFQHGLQSWLGIKFAEVGRFRRGRTNGKAGS